MKRGAILLISSLLGLAALVVPGIAAAAGPTISPDLLAVTDVTATDQDYNGSGTDDTTAVFTFDEPTVVASCCAGFQLVHTDVARNEPLTAIDVLSGEGTTELVIAFEGQIAPENTARGTVDKNIVRVEGTSSQTNNPPQAAPVVGQTNAPDLVSVRQDLNTLLFTFDEPTDNDDDVIQNTSGLRFYTEQSITYSAAAVERVDSTTLRAVFDLPQGTTVSDAVGGYVIAGTVAGSDVDGDGNFETNELDETLVGDPINDSTTCPPTTVTDSTPSDLTVAPDLQFVGNFRQGPYTPELEPTTCVDFDFDQVAYLGGGNRTSFHLVPVDLVDREVLDGSDIQPESDQAGDDKIVVVYLGDLDESDFARGYVDSEVVTSNENGDPPYNKSQAEPISNDGNTTNPDLVSVRQDHNTLLFEFDQDITEDDDVVQNPSGLRFMTEDVREYGALAVAQVDPFTLRAVYDLPQGTTVKDAVAGFVDQGTVVGADVDNDGTFEPNAFDETVVGEPLNPYVSCPPSTVDESGLPDSWTDAPDLQFAGNFRQGPYTVQVEPTTCVDYDFDTEAYLAGSNRTSFHLVPRDGGPVLDASDMVPDSDEAGDDKIITIYLGLYDEADFARGYVDNDVVADNEAGTGPLNVAQADAISNAGNSDDPDLETISEKSDNKLYFEFDEDLDQEDVVQDTAGLRFYTAEGDIYAASRVYPTNREDVLVAKFDLPKGVSARDAVGGLVTQGTVVAPDDDGDGTKEAISFDEVRKSDGSIQKDTVEVID